MDIDCLKENTDKEQAHVNAGVWLGCGLLFVRYRIRVKDPFELAEKLLDGQSDWNRAKIDDVIASGVTTRVNLDRPMRIIIAYATALADAECVIFRQDIYNRDSKVLEALDAEFKIRKQDL